jgi:hypothetical protein
VAPSISSPIPGLDGPKATGQPCPQLDAELRCRLFGDPARPAVCDSLRPALAMCGADRDHALRWLTQLEVATAP